MCSPEIAISAANWDKQSTWEKLAKRLKIKSWEQILKETNGKEDTKQG